MWRFYDSCRVWWIRPQEPHCTSKSFRIDPVFSRSYRWTRIWKGKVGEGGSGVWPRKGDSAPEEVVVKKGSRHYTTFVTVVYRHQVVSRSPDPRGVTRSGRERKDLGGSPQTRNPAPYWNVYTQVSGFKVLFLILREFSFFCLICRIISSL